ncbi:MAG: AraC family transcriptional regulator [Lachnospiraceae bacterium]|nr:AraC family transcriptional regulator [Lachnospiraceae bacterium]
MKDFIFSNDYFRSLDAYVYTCGYETCEPGHSYGPVLRSGYLIHYVLGGKGYYRVNNTMYRLEEGDAFLICPDELIYYEADKKEPWTYTWIGFQGVKIRGYLERTSLPATPVFHYGHDDRIRLCHEKMFEANQLSGNRDLIMNSILYEYLFLLARKFPREQISPGEKQSIYVEEALRYLESRYGQELSIQALADELGLDRSHLHRVFKAATGVSPQEYLLDLRIRKASELLKRTDLPISVIALSVGYEDTLYFSRLFKKKKGQSPTRYRALS